ncbi:SH2 domain-containing protein 4B-like, partial [Saccoglossus kowalevskii]
SLQIITNLYFHRAKEEAIRLEKQKAEDDRIAREKARLEAERKKKQEEAAIYATLKQAKLEAQMEKERKEKERQMAELLEQEKKRKIQMEKEEKESKSREEDLRKKWQLRAQEIYQRGKQKRERNNKDAETESKQTDEFWKEQQEKSKIADRHRSERAKQARRSLRMSVDYSTLGMPGVVEQAMQQNLHKPKPALPPRPQKTRPDRPRNRRDITEWFLEVEKPKMTGIDPKTNRPAKWFHGIIKRSVAEDLLMSKQVGTFLVRISERVWGYVISYKDEDRCKHFLIDASDNTYQFFGANQIAHETLNDLVNYHK